MNTVGDDEISTDPGSRSMGVVTGIADLPGNAYIDSKELGRLIGRCKKSIQRAVRRGELPPPVKFMGRHVWLVKTILDHFEERQRAACQQMKQRQTRLKQNMP